MKKIINGKKYDTETAIEIHNIDGGNGCSDFNYFEETLYKKKTGEFFLYGEGNAASKYSKRTPGGMSARGTDIIPLNEDQAKEWCENYLSVEEYETIFGSVPE